VSIAHVRLSVDVGSDPISGSLQVDQQPSQPFCGWVELAAAIEALHVAQPRHSTVMSANTRTEARP
jgi:hypothetical protein